MKKISQKQLKANKRNSKLGGVKTAEGKKISKYNALKHGILAKELLLEEEDKNSFISFKKNIIKGLKPYDEIEMFFTNRIISNIWRLKRALKVELNSVEYAKNITRDDFEITNKGIEQRERKAVIKGIDNNTTEKILRYETTLERSIFKSLHELLRLQAIRKGNNPEIPAVIDVNFDDNY